MLEIHEKLTHETWRKVDVGAHLAVNLDKALHANLLGFLVREGVLETITQEQNEREAFSQLVRAGGRSWCLDHSKKEDNIIIKTQISQTFQNWNSNLRMNKMDIIIYACITKFCYKTEVYVQSNGTCLFDISTLKHWINVFNESGFHHRE